MARRKKREPDLQVPGVVVVGGREYTFPFDLLAIDENCDVGELSRQIAETPANYGYVVEAHASAERHAAELKSDYDIWLGGLLLLHDGGKDAANKPLTEAAKMRLVSREHEDLLRAKKSEITEAEYKVRLLRGLKDALDLKGGLMQTLARNIREERRRIENE